MSRTALFDDLFFILKGIARYHTEKLRGSLSQKEFEKQVQQIYRESNFFILESVCPVDVPEVQPRKLKGEL